jgi:hypothetical protein
MKDLHEILQEKELAIKRLEREIEAIRVVLGILEEESMPTPIRTETKPQPVAATPPEPRSYQPLERSYASGTPNSLPAIPTNYGTNAGSPPSELPLVEPRKTSSRNWP